MVSRTDLVILTTISLLLVKGIIAKEVHTSSTDHDDGGHDRSYNDKYNEVVQSSFIETIDSQLPKEGKFFDDFNRK